MSFSWRASPPALRRNLAKIPQSTLAIGVAHLATRRRLRIFALHGVPDQGRFGRLLDAVCGRYVPVDGDAVDAAVHGRAELPDHAAWITFDDGLRSTFEAGSMLRDRSISATAFVCPGVIGQQGLLWFQAVDNARELGLIRASEEARFAEARLKTLHDDTRRREVEVLERRLEEAGFEQETPVAVSDLREWVGQGHEIGNHTWDHPCLDKCISSCQEYQIMRAHETLLGWGFRPRFFAYPNGNWTETASDILERQGYAGSVLFDHRLTKTLAQPQRISRLRIDSDVSARRGLSIASGAHSFAYQLVVK